MGTLICVLSKSLYRTLTSGQSSDSQVCPKATFSFPGGIYDIKWSPHSKEAVICNKIKVLSRPSAKMNTYASHLPHVYVLQRNTIGASLHWSVLEVVSGSSPVKSFHDRHSKARNRIRYVFFVSFVHICIYTCIYDTCT